MKTKYQNLLKKEEWKTFRSRILELDNYTCTKCDTCYKEEPSNLNIHHKVYYRGLRPWEYNPEDVTTYCRRCHAEEHNLLEMPKFGWEYIGMEDLGNLVGRCDYCDSQLRYQHTVYHPSVGYLYVGATCANSLTESQEASELEKREKRKRSSLKKWEKGEDGMLFRNFNKNRFEIHTNGDSFTIKIDGYVLDESFLSINEAKCFAFELYVNGMINEMVSDLHQKEWEQFKNTTNYDLLTEENNDLITGFYSNHHFYIRKIYHKVNEYIDDSELMEEFEIYVDAHHFDTRKNIADAQLFLFELLHDPIQFRSIRLNKKNDILYEIINNLSRWKGKFNDKYFDYGFITFRFNNKEKMLSVKHKRYLVYSMDKHSTYYFTPIKKCADFEEAKNIAYTNLCNYTSLIKAIEQDDYVHFMLDVNWIKEQSNQYIIYTNNIGEISISIYQSNDGYCTMSVGSIKGHKKLKCLEEAKKIAYNYIKSGKYDNIINNRNQKNVFS